MQITIFRTFMLRTLTIYALLYGLFAKYDLDKPQLPAWQAGVVTPQVGEVEGNSRGKWKANA